MVECNFVRSTDDRSGQNWKETVSFLSARDLSGTMFWVTSISNIRKSSCISKPPAERGNYRDAGERIKKICMSHSLSPSIASGPELETSRSDLRQGRKPIAVLVSER